MTQLPDMPRLNRRFRMQWDIVPDRGEVTQWYPGDGWIDIISQDVYWHPQYDGSNPTDAFNRHKSGNSSWRGLDWVAQFARDHGKGIAIPEWGVPGDRSDLAGDVFIGLMRDWMRANYVVFADYWASTSAYNGLLHDGQPAAAADALKALFIGGVGGDVLPPPDEEPPPEAPEVTGGHMTLVW